jgi:hypothetical protein
MGEQFVYLVRLAKEEYSIPHVKAFLDRKLADEYFESDVKFYRKKGWSIDDDKNYCGGVNIVRRAEMMKKNDEGKYEHMTLVLEAFEIIKK